MIRVTGVLRTGILCLALAIVACSHNKVEAMQMAQPKLVAEKFSASTVANNNNKTIILKPGQSTRIDASTTLHYIRLVSDSRCPVDRRCIWAGEATIELTLESGNEKKTFPLTDRANTKSVMGFSIALVSIDRGHQISILAQKL